MHPNNYDGRVKDAATQLLSPMVCICRDCRRFAEFINRFRKDRLFLRLIDSLSENFDYFNSLDVETAKTEIAWWIVRCDVRLSGTKLYQKWAIQKFAEEMFTRCFRGHYKWH